MIIAVAAAAAYLVYTSTQRPAVRLVVASRLSAEEADAVRSAFLASDIARRYNVVDVEIKKLDYSLWKDLSVRGEVDLLIVGEPSIFNSLCEAGALRYLDSRELIEEARRTDYAMPMVLPFVPAILSPIAVLALLLGLLTAAMTRGVAGRWTTASGGGITGGSRAHGLLRSL